MGLILIANPGSSSRKYALFSVSDDKKFEQKAAINIETSDKGLICTIHIGAGDGREHAIDFTDVTESALHAEQIMRSANVLGEHEAFDAIAIRIVAPSSYFMHDHVIDGDFMHKLTATQELAPIHIANVLHEIELLQQAHPHTKTIGVSDSAFHITKPGYAWNYGISLQDADTYDIKRFGYHGLSVQASIDTLWSIGKLPPKVIVCHLGSGSSVTAVFHGRSIDTTMGYSPLEGVLMATRSGNIDPTAVKVLRNKLQLNEDQMEEYLNHQGGLLGLGGSSDIRELIEREANGDHLAHLALATLVHTYHKAIGGMIVTLGGADMLVFTGTVGERSAILRKRIVAHLAFADYFLDGATNEQCLNPEKPTLISAMGRSKPVIVIPANESLQIAKKASALL